MKKFFYFRHNNYSTCKPKLQKVPNAILQKMNLLEYFDPFKILILNKCRNKTSRFILPSSGTIKLSKNEILGFLIIKLNARSSDIIKSTKTRHPFVINELKSLNCLQNKKVSIPY